MAERTYLTEFGRPVVVEAFSGLKTITRRFKINGEATRAASIDDPAKGFLAYATADKEFPNALLVDFRTDQIESKPNTHDLILTEVYSEFEDNQKTPVGEDVISYDESGRKQIVRKYVVKAEDAEATAADIGDVDGDGLACNGVQIVKNGVGATIAETYIAGGKLSEVTRESNNGALITKTLTYYNEIPPTPVGFVLVDTAVQNTEGVPTYTYSFAKGDGLVSVSIDARQDGLRQVTHVSLGTKSTPAGVVVRDDLDELDGYIRYTVSSMQSAAGGAPTGVSYNYGVKRQFLYPGRAKIYSVVIGDRTMFDCFKSSPIQADVDADVEISYQTSDVLSYTGTYWNPDEWATLFAKLVTRYGEPVSIVDALPGYRSVDDSEESFAAPNIVGEEASFLGHMVYGGTTATIRVIGGPEDPGGNTYVLDAQLDPAFMATDGTIYFRRTVIRAEIPTQPALPV